MEKGIDVNVNAELKADLQPVIEKTPSALNKLFELLFGIKHAERKRVIELINAQREKDQASVENGLAIFDVVNKSLNPISHNFNGDYSSLIGNTIEHEEISNISNCAKHAARNLLDAELSSQDEITKDFFNRWRNEAKLISDESAQTVWGLILSEEIKTPNSISLRALDILKNLTKKEAELFDYMGRFVAYGSALITGEHISNNQLQQLADAGLINFAGVYRSSIWLKKELRKDESVTEVPYIRCCDYFIHSEPSKIDHEFSYMPLTDAGMAIYRIALKNNKWDVTEALNALLKNKKAPKKVTYYKYESVYLGTVDLDHPHYYPSHEESN